MSGKLARGTMARRAGCLLLVAVLALAAPASPSVARVFPYQLPAGAVLADVVVYAATPGGILAAVSAARAGATVALVEASGHVGGMMSNGLSYTDLGDPSTLGGYTKEFFDRVIAIEGTPEVAGKPSARYAFEPHVAERVFNDMLRSSEP